MEAKVDKSIIVMIDNLMTKSRDANEGYLKASENVEDPAIQKALSQYASNRAGFVEALKFEIDQLGGYYEDRTSTTSSLHRFWIDLKGTLTGNDKDAILKECLRGENASLKDYDEALLNKELPTSTQVIIEDHHRKIAKTIKELERLIG